jgi:predicted Zn-dependent peptidase
VGTRVAPTTRVVTISRMLGHELTTLPSGVRVISERIDTVRSVSIGFWIGSGARDETNARAGVSHFIEHLLFKGSDRFSAVEIAEIFDTMGGELNAATSRETTVVYTRIPDESLEQALDVMAEMVFRPSFADVDHEREVVLEEIAMVDDNPQDHVHDLAAEALFASHPLGRPVIGSADVIRSVGRRTLRAHHRAAYAGPNVVVAAAGNVDHAHFADFVAARAPENAVPAGLSRKPLRRRPPPGIRFLSRDTEQYHVCLSGSGIARDDERRFAAALLDAIVGGSSSSRLFQEIREKRGMAYSVYSYASQYADSGQVGLYVGTREENLAECLEVVARELRELGAGSIRPGELERAKQNLKSRLLLSLESTSSRMTRLGKALVTDVDLLDVEEVLERVMAVEPGEVATLAEELFAPERLSAAAIGPREQSFRDAVEHVNPVLLAKAA